MDNCKTRAAFFVSIALTLYLLNLKKASILPHQNGISSFTPISLVYEGYEARTENLILAFLEKKTVNETATFRMIHYNGPWESQELNIIYFHILLNRQNRSIVNDQDFFYSTSYKKLSKNTVKLNISYENLDELEGKIYNFDTLMLEFNLKKMDAANVYLKRLIYGVGASFLYLMYFYVLNKHYNQCELSQSFAEKTSLFTLVMLELLELSFMFWQIKKAFEKPITTGVNFILISALWSFSIYLYIHTKLIVKIFLAKNPALSDFPYFVRSRFISSYQSRIFTLIVVSMVSLKFLNKFYYLTLPLLHFFFIPQIVLNSLKGYKQSFSLSFIFVIIIVKSVFTCYFCLLPQSILRYKPDYYLALQILIVLASQGIVLYLQSTNPRILIPKKYHPVSYNYFRSDSEESYLESRENTCTICMTGLNILSNSEPVHNFSKTMHTPCNHPFHQDCLMRWMEIKMECPTCRANIPEVVD
jgi:hypothetical protein